MGLTDTQRAELGARVAELKVMLDEAEYQISINELGNVNWHMVATNLIVLTGLIHRYYNPVWARMYEAAGAREVKGCQPTAEQVAPLAEERQQTAHYVPAESNMVEEGEDDEEDEDPSSSNW